MPDSPSDRSQWLTKRLTEVDESIKQWRWKIFTNGLPSLWFGIGVIFIVYTVILGTTLSELTEEPELGAVKKKLIGGGSFLFSLIVVASTASVAVRRFVRELEQTREELDSQLHLEEHPGKPPEQRAGKMFRLHTLHLQRYYDQNLKQNRVVLLFGVGYFVVGLVLAGVAFYTLAYNPGTAIEWLTAGSGTVGATLSTFVSGNYVKIYTQPAKNLSDFHSRLVTSNQLLLGNLLTSQIANEGLREKTLAKVAVNLSARSPSSVGTGAFDIPATTAGQDEPEPPPNPAPARPDIGENLLS